CMMSSLSEGNVSLIVSWAHGSQSTRSPGILRASSACQRPRFWRRS
ncbi:unnamed protein product, partial [Mycena citricolor]